MEWFSILTGGWRLAEIVTVAVQVCIVSLPYEPPLFVDYTPLFTVAVQVCIVSLPYEPPLWIIHPCLLWQCRSVLCPSLTNPLCGLYTPVYCGSAGLYYVPPLWTPFVCGLYTPVYCGSAGLYYVPSLWTPFVDYTPLFTVAVQVCIMSLPYEPPLWIIHPCLLWQCRSVLCPSLMNPLCLWIIHPCLLWQCRSVLCPFLMNPLCGLYTPVYCGSAGLYYVPSLWTPFVDYTPLFTVAVQVCIASLPYEPPLWIIHHPQNCLILFQIDTTLDCECVTCMPF